jgi:hypothetical protein
MKCPAHDGGIGTESLPQDCHVTSQILMSLRGASPGGNGADDDSAGKVKGMSPGKRKQCQKRAAQNCVMTGQQTQDQPEQVLHVNPLSRSAIKASEGRSGSQGLELRIRQSTGAQCFLLQDKGTPGWQDFVDYISVQIVARLIVSQLNQPFFG